MKKKSRNLAQSYRVILLPSQWGQKKGMGVSREKMETGGMWTSAPPSPTGTGIMNENYDFRMLHQPHVIYYHLTTIMYFT